MRFLRRARLTQTTKTRYFALHVHDIVLQKDLARDEHGTGIRPSRDSLLFCAVTLAKDLGVSPTDRFARSRGHVQNVPR